MNRALVTGASGFIGSHLCHRLVREGVEVHGVTRQLQADDLVQWTRADVTDADVISSVVQRVEPDVLFHLAAFSRGTRALDAVLPSVHDTVVGGANVLLAATRFDVPVVLTGSMEEPVGGETPASPYAAAKQAIGSYARMLHALHGLRLIALRPFMVYGPAHEDYGKLLPYVITSLLRGDRPRLSSGTRPVDWVYVADVVDAFVAAAGGDHAWSGETLDIGSGELVTIRDIVMRVSAIIDPGFELVFGELADRPFETVRVADVTRAGELIGWTPRTSLDEGLRLTIDWYRKKLSSLVKAGRVIEL